MKYVRAKINSTNQIINAVIDDKNDSVREISGDFTSFSYTGNMYTLEELTLLSPVCPSKVVAVGLNYKDHAKEMNMPLPESPVLFIKPSTSVIGNSEKIIYPKNISQLDYEAELAIVIKKEAKNILLEDAKDYILGYTCCNDVTARDLQKLDGQWTRAKSFDTFCPLGPWIVDELKNNASIKTYLNGKIKQDSSLDNLIFDVNYLVYFISQIMTLLPNDVIITGTPSGIGPMNIGDKVEVVIDGIGGLKNVIGNE